MATRRRYIDIPDHARRDFIKWTIGLGAALGLRPWKVFEVQESVVGPAVAANASCASVNRFVGFVMGNGGLAWNTQLWPHPGQATIAGAAFYATGKATAQANASDAALFEAYYKANLSLHAAAARPTMTAGLRTGKVAANLLGKNLASQLRPTAADLARYGITGGTSAKLSSIGNALITTA